MPFLFLSFILAGALSSEQAPQARTEAGRVSGRVVEDGTNAPLSGARMTVFPLDRAPVVPYPVGPPPQTITDEDGRYVFDGLPPGRYRIDAQKAGFASPSPSDPSVFRTLQLAAGQTLDGVNISLQRGAVITGQILDPSSGEPLVNAMVMAMRRPDAAGAPAGPGGPGGPGGVVLPGMPRLLPAGQNAQTNDLGEFRIFALPPGEYFVAASQSPNSGFGTHFISSTAEGTVTTAAAPTTQAVLTFYPGTADAAAAQPVMVGAGQVVAGIVIRLLTAQTYQVSGTVVDETGAPVAGAMVMLRGDPRTSAFFAGPAGQGRSDASGNFVIGGVTTGSYMAMASVPVMMSSQGGGAGGVSFYSAGGIASGPQAMPRFSQLDITVNDANVEGVQIVVQRPQ